MMHDSAPIFIAGDYRSGTTLLSVILDSHADLVCGHSLNFLQPENLGPHVLLCCELLTRGDPRVQGQGLETPDARWQLGVQFVKECHRFGIDYSKLQALVSEQIAAHGGSIQTFEERCMLIESIGEYRRTCAGVVRWGVAIQRQIWWADVFTKFWPKAQFIHIVRDGRDVAASHLRGAWPWAYHTIEEAARGWVAFLHAAERAVSSQKWIEVRYEDLVANTEVTLRSLLEFLCLEWDDAVLRHFDVQHALFDHYYLHPSVKAVQQRIGAVAIGRYRTDLTPQQIAVFERLAGRSLQSRNYDLQSC
jgi:hypothetical protein